MRTFKEWRDNRSTNTSSTDPLHSVGVYTHQRLTENEDEYECDDILHFWYLCNQDSPAVKKFIVSLNDLMDECFPNEHKFAETQESELSSLIHRYILVRHGDER